MTKNKIFFVNQLLRLRGSDSSETREQLLEWKILDLMIDIRKERILKGKDPGPDPVAAPEPEPIEPEPEPEPKPKPEPAPGPEPEPVADVEDEYVSFLHRAGSRF